MAIVVWLLLAEALYVRALRVLAGRGVRVPRGQAAAAGRVPDAAPAARRDPGLRRRPLRLAPHGRLRGRRPPRAGPRAPARELHLRRDRRLVAGARAETAATARGAVEDRPHPRRPHARHVS